MSIHIVFEAFAACISSIILHVKGVIGVLWHFLDIIYDNHIHVAWKVQP